MEKKQCKRSLCNTEGDLGGGLCNSGGVLGGGLHGGGGDSGGGLAGLMSEVTG